jgi:Domain of unknown function (DUF4174)
VGGACIVLSSPPGALTFFTHLLRLFASLLCMHVSRALQLTVLALLSTFSWAAMIGQTRNPQPSAACPAQPNTLRAMRGCYRPLLVFAPTMDDPQLVEQFNQLKGHATELNSRDLLYVPIVPEGHNQPIPGSRIHTASFSEDELAAMRHHFKVEPDEFLVILVGKDGEEKLNSRTPVPVDRLERLIDSMPMRQRETQQDQQGDQ